MRTAFQTMKFKVYFVLVEVLGISGSHGMLPWRDEAVSGGGRGVDLTTRDPKSCTLALPPPHFKLHGIHSSGRMYSTSISRLFMAVLIEALSVAAVNV